MPFLIFKRQDSLHPSQKQVLKLLTKENSVFSYQITWRTVLSAKMSLSFETEEDKKQEIFFVNS